ncbi:MAG: sigma-70 family RNA polymerase sigma factor [Cytophagales bacterium]|nr:sigma-70 family RNA polymerase sigma factor [Cytophagales bacterium]
MRTKKFHFGFNTQGSDIIKAHEHSARQETHEKDIWNDFKHGSDSALSYIYRNYVNQLFNYGCQIVDDDEFIKDCVQDLFMDLIRSRKNLGNVNSIKHYLYVSLRRRIFRKLKKEKSYMKDEIRGRPEVQFEIISSPETKMIEEHLTVKKRELIEMACKKLTAKQREAILLYFYEGFTYKQVAEIMGMGKVKSARVMIYRAIDALQSSLINARDLLFFMLLCIGYLFL